MPPPLVIAPGLGDSGPGHWQTLWEQQFGAVRVRQDDLQRTTPASRTVLLDQVVRETPGVWC